MKIKTIRKDVLSLMIYIIFTIVIDSILDYSFLKELILATMTFTIMLKIMNIGLAYQYQMYDKKNID